MKEGEEVWVRTEPTLDGKSFMVVIEFDPDNAVTLTPLEAHDYVDTVYAALARAEYDAAVFKQMTRRLTLTARQAAETVLDLRRRRTELGSLGPMKLEPGMSKAGKPFLKLMAGQPATPVGQWSPDDARGHASAILEAIAVADLDRQYLAELTETIGIEEDRARAVVNDLINYR